MSRPLRIPTLGRHAATGQARVLIDGRHVYLGKYGSDEAEEKYRRIVAELVASSGATTPTLEPTPAGQLTINQLVLTYWKEARRYYRKNGRPRANSAH